jgi:hypothetical protein
MGTADAVEEVPAGNYRLRDSLAVYAPGNQVQAFGFNTGERSSRMLAPLLVTAGRKSLNAMAGIGVRTWTGAAAGSAFA